MSRLDDERRFATQSGVESGPDMRPAEWGIPEQRYLERQRIKDPAPKVNRAEGDGCLCQNCGRLYRVDVTVPDSLWERIKPKDKADGAGLLCGSCIINRIEALGDFGCWFLSASSASPPVGEVERIEEIIEKHLWHMSSGQLAGIHQAAQAVSRALSSARAETPKITAQYECEENGLTGTCSAPVKRIERQDDDSFTVVIDHWPQSRAEAVKECRWCLNSNPTALWKVYYRGVTVWECIDKDPCFDRLASTRADREPRP